MDKVVVLHLTVTRDGWISLWDRPGPQGPDDGDPIDLELTPEQAELLRRTMRDSTVKYGLGDGPYRELAAG